MDEALSHWKTPTDLRKAVRNLIDDPAALGTPPESVHHAINQVVSERLARANELRAHPWAQWQQEVTDLLNGLNKAKRLNGNSKNAMLKVWDSLLAWAESNELLPEKLDSAAGYKNQTPEGLDNILKGDDQAPHHPAFDAIEALLELFDGNLESLWHCEITPFKRKWIKAVCELIGTDSCLFKNAVDLKKMRWT